MNKRYWKWCKNHIHDLSDRLEEVNKLAGKKIRINPKYKFEPILEFWVGLNAMARIYLKKKYKIEVKTRHIVDWDYLYCISKKDGQFDDSILVDLKNLRGSDIADFKEKDTYYFTVEDLKDLEVISHE